MSLILEALRKLDREKDSPHKGFLVLGTLTPPRRTSRRTILAAATSVVTLALVAAAALVPRLVAPPLPPAARVPGDAAGAAPPAAAGNGIGPAPQPARPAPALDAPPRQPMRTLFEQSRAATKPVPAAPPVDTPASDVSPTPSAGPGLEPSPAGPNPEALVLEAIGEREGERIAVVSGRLVREGDVFGGTRVLRIGVSEVEVETAGERRVLRF